MDCFDVFGYDIDVSLEDIKSPLPPRKVVFRTETENENMDPRVSLVEEEKKISNNVLNPLRADEVEKKKKNKKRGGVMAVPVCVLRGMGLTQALGKRSRFLLSHVRVIASRFMLEVTVWRVEQQSVVRPS